MAHTYQLGLFPKQYHTMLPRGLQQNKTLISLNVICNFIFLKKKKKGRVVAGARVRRATAARCFSGLLHVRSDGKTQDDGCGGQPERTQMSPAAA